MRLKRIQPFDIPPPTRKPKPSKWDEIVRKTLRLELGMTIEVPESMFSPSRTYGDPPRVSTAAQETQTRLRHLIRDRRLPLRTIVRHDRLFIQHTEECAH